MGADRTAVGGRHRLRTLAVDPPQPARWRGARLLSGLHAQRNPPGGTGRRRRPALDNRRMLPARQGGTGPGSLRSPILAWLAPPYDVMHVGSRISGPIAGRATPRRIR